MIIITGGAGFIGSALLWRLNQEGLDHILVVDDVDTSEKWLNLRKRRFYMAYHKDDFLAWLKTEGNREKISAVFHLGACSSTTESDWDFLLRNNVHYSMALFNFCRDRHIPFIYASSAATYGNGEQGYDDDPALIPHLRPLNRYGLSKHLFDCWVLKQRSFPPFWAGLKFFNVYGPGEYHKGPMQSLVCKALPQVQEANRIRLFKSYRAGIAHGEQKRDFIYVKDVVEVMLHFWRNATTTGSPIEPGIYNVGSGQASSFAELAKAVFSAMDRPAQLEWVDMPIEIRNGYQYYTQAKLDRLRSKAAYNQAFTPVEEAVKDYVCQYLLKEDRYL